MEYETNIQKIKKCMIYVQKILCTKSVLTLDEIDALTIICKLLLKHNLYNSYYLLILNCPANFMKLYAADEEQISVVLRQLSHAKFDNLCKYINKFINS